MKNRKFGVGRDALIPPGNLPPRQTSAGRKNPAPTNNGERGREPARVAMNRNFMRRGGIHPARGRLRHDGPGRYGIGPYTRGGGGAASPWGFGGMRASRPTNRGDRQTNCRRPSSRKVSRADASIRPYGARQDLRIGRGRSLAVCRGRCLSSAREPTARANIRGRAMPAPTGSAGGTV